MKRAVCLLSGGMDSAVASAIAKSEGYELFALTFLYNQRNIRELDSANKLVIHFEIQKHMVFNIDLRQIGGSALTDSLDMPAGKSADEIRGDNEIPITYVPARNTIFLSIALGYAEAVDADSIFIGANYMDSSGYPDCRPGYLKKFQEMADLATKRAVGGNPIGIEYPLIDMNKAEIVKRGMALRVPFGLTWSCYNDGEKACGECDSCALRLNAFKEAGYEDPIEYEKK